MRGREVAIVGAHATPQLKDAEGPSLDLALTSLRRALDDAGLTKSALDGIFASETVWPLAPGRGGEYFRYANWATQLGIPVRWFTGAVNSAHTGASAINDAAAAIAAGYVDTIAVVVGRSSTSDLPGATVDYTRTDFAWTAWTGSYTSAQHALVACRHMDRYGTTPEQLALAAAVSRNHGRNHPDARMAGRGPYSVADILASEMISSPLTRLMCSVPSTGGSAVIVTTMERARDLPGRPVRVLGGGDQLCYPAWAEAPLLELPNGQPFPTAWVDHAFEMSGVRREDVDVVQLSDTFAIAQILQWEMLGFCSVGEGGPYIESGVTGLAGRHPTCTDGGLQAFGNNGSPGLDRVVEAVRQLRGDVADGCPEAPDGVHIYDPDFCRAARSPEVALALTVGPPTGGGSVVLLARG